jgi:hypothetical protein
MITDTSNVVRNVTNFLYIVVFITNYSNTASYVFERRLRPL